MKSSPLVSICIPTFNRTHYLKEAVASGLAQSYENVEVLVGDDGQSGEIREWGESLARCDARVRYRRNARRLGLAGNWNALADSARGEFITIIGDDDRLLPDFVSSLVEAAMSGADVAFSNHYLIDERGERLTRESQMCTRTYGRDKLVAGFLENAAAVVWQNSVPMSAALIRAEHVKRLRFKEDLNTPEIEFFARLAEESGRFVFVPDYLAEYRTHAQSATSAGLLSENLARYLISMQVSPEVEKYKREFLGPLLVNAVGRCLSRGERVRAQDFLRSEYYPRPAVLSDAVRSRAQRMCAGLPAFIGSPLYRIAARVKRKGSPRL